MIKSHGGDDEPIKNPESLLNAKYCFEVRANVSGYVSEINALEIAKYVMALENEVGEERRLFQGVMLSVQINSAVKVGDCVARIYSDKKLTEDDIQKLNNVLTFSSKKRKEEKLIYKVIKE